MDHAGIADHAHRVAAAHTVPGLVQRNAREYGDHPALTWLEHDEPTLSWRELAERAADVAAGLADLGLGAGDRMLMLMSGRPEHWIVDLAAAHLGAISSTVYATLAPDQLRYVAAHSRAPILVLEGAAELARWQPLLPELPDVRHVIVLDGSGGHTSFAELRERGAAVRAADVDGFARRWAAVRPDEPVTLLYTSGTTGDPKGVLLSHANVVYQAAALEASVDTPPHPSTVAYLPLAHIAERMLGIYIPLYRAGHVHICSDPTRLVAALNAVRPTTFFGVPRVWEKMAAGLAGYLRTAPEPVRAAVSAAGATAVEAYRLREAGQEVPADLAARVAAVDAAVLRPIRATLGLDNLLWASSGAAPIPVEVLLQLAGVGIDVLEVWGMTETTGTATDNLPDRFRAGSVGAAHAGMEIRIADDGEILARGPLVALGYLRADGGVTPMVDREGWLATGDIGTVDDDGFLTITDRKKELIITSAGKNIAPAAIENKLRASPLIAQAVAIGDRRPYVTALIALDEEAAPAWAAAHGIDATDLEVLAVHPKVTEEIERVIDAANAELARPEQVKRFRIVGDRWSPESGEVTPTLKLRRRVITDRYAPQIEEL